MKKFITFGGPTPNFHRSVQRICEEARLLDVFDEIRGFTEKDLMEDTDFWKRHGNFICNNRRGFGYWIWKSHLIKKIFDSLNEGDILVYCDAGCHVNKNGVDRLNEYIEMLRTSREGYGVISFQLEFKEYQYTKRAIFEHFESSRDIQESNQCMATILVIMKNRHSESILKSWVDNARYDLLNDTTAGERAGFVENRHDQSILSVIVNTNGSIKLKDETYFHPNWSEGARFPFHARRWK
jgi:hypothetical protein